MGSYFTLFVRSGGIYFDAGTVGGPHSGGMGDTNRTWSSRSGAATDAYDLNFNAADVHPSWGPRNRYHGLPPPLVLPRRGADLLTFTFFSSHP